MSKAVVRALAILSHLQAEIKTAHRLTDLVDQLRYPKSQTFRLLEVLIAEQLVVRTPDHKYQAVIGQGYVHVRKPRLAPISALTSSPKKGALKPTLDFSAIHNSLLPQNHGSTHRERQRNP